MNLKFRTITLTVSLFLVSCTPRGIGSGQNRFEFHIAIFPSNYVLGKFANQEDTSEDRRQQLRRNWMNFSENLDLTYTSVHRDFGSLKTLKRNLSGGQEGDMFRAISAPLITVEGGVNQRPYG